MPYVRRSYRKPSYRRRIPYRRKRTFGKRRFSRKKFAKNNINQLTMRAPVASRLLRIKLPWVMSVDDTIPASNTLINSYQGSAIVPWTSNGNSGAFTNYNFATAGDILPSGEVEYSQLYDRYFVNGSSIKVEALTAENFTGVVRAVLLAVPFTSSGPTNTPPDDYPGVRNQLDGYSYEQLLSWPHAKWRMLGTADGGKSRLIFKMFRKTKHMTGKKDLRDDSTNGGNLTDGLYQFPSGTSSWNINPTTGFMYYLRFFNTASTDVDINLTVRMSLYLTLVSREFNPTRTILSAA